MTDTSDAALDALVKRLNDKCEREFSYDRDADEAADAITALRAKVDEVTAQRDAAREAAIANAEFVDLVVKFRNERDAALARESTAFAWGVRAAAKKLPELFAEWESDPTFGLDDMCRIYFPNAIRALADAPPAPVVGVKPDAAIILAKEMQMIVAADRWKGRPLTSTPPEKWHHLGPETQQFWTDTAARILAALLPRMEGGDA